MSKWTTRLAASSAIAIGAVGLSMAAGFAAAPGPTASAGPTGAQATALGVPGVVTVSESSVSPGASTFPGDAHWSAATVAGTEVIGKGSGNQWTGAAAALGPVLDSVNEALCPDNETPIDGDTSLSVCVRVLNGGASSGPYYGSFAGGEAVFGQVVAYDGTQVYGVGAIVARSNASDYFCSKYAGASLLDYGYQLGDDSTGDGGSVSPVFAERGCAG